MKFKSALFVALLLACSFITPAAQATVLRVVTIQTDDVGAYVKEIEHGQALLKKLGSPAVLRIWRARFAGPDAGVVMVAIEYPDLTAFAADDRMVSADPGYSAWLKGLAKLRKIVSDSFYDGLNSP